MTENQIHQMIEEIQRRVQKTPHKVRLYEDWFAAIRLLGEDPGRRFAAYSLLPKLRECIQGAMAFGADPDEAYRLYDLIGKTYLYAARDDFDSYCIYLEWKRTPDKKFYQPRRRVLYILAQDLQDLADRKIDFLGVSLPPRVGKLLADDTPVLTRAGWKNHGDLVVGDEVIAPDGRFVKVLAVHPKNVADVRVHFTDGSYVDAHENHEWRVYNRHRGRYETLETRQMMGDYETGEPGKRRHRYFYQLPLRAPVEGEHKDLPVEPYTLGAWLGDGRNGNPDICGAPSDYAIVERIWADGYEVSWETTHKTTGVRYYGFRSLRPGLQKLGMCHSRRRTPKYIPDMYLTASVEQRLDLLAGLLDTDGCLVRSEHRYQFTTSEPELRDSVVALVSSFGWRPCVREVAPYESSSGVCGKLPVWTVSFNPTCYIPCQLERKQLREFSKQRKIAISGFERIDPVPGNCITVEGGLYCVGRTLIPTHNSTICIFFITWLMGRNPDTANVMSGHSDKLTDGFYNEVLNILTDEDTYNWHEIFPEYTWVDKSAKNETINIGRRKRFPSLTCRSIGGTLTGAVEIGEQGVLYCDDLVEDLEESLNLDRLNAKYDAYLNQLKDRKKQGAMELMVGTRWNVFDPLGRVQAQYADNPRYRFRVIPALDENDHSNFVYDYGVGFDDAYYHDMRASIDQATWLAKYQGNPVIREGLLFPEDELKWYNGVLPDGEPDRKVMVMDIAWGGGDFLAAPIAYVYGSDVYIHDVVFSDGDKTVTKPLVCGMIKRHQPHTMRGEANNGGDEYCESVDSMLRADGYHVNIRSQKAPNTQSKLSRIIQYAPDIKNFYFVDAKHSSPEYRKFMQQVTLFTQMGKNPHDDAPDSLAMLADELLAGMARVEPMRRPF